MSATILSKNNRGKLQITRDQLEDHPSCYTVVDYVRGVEIHLNIPEEV